MTLDSKILVSCHLPKTAGSSFLKSLEEVYTKTLLKDFDDRPINHSAFQRRFNALKMFCRNSQKDLKDYQCIHGHFLPLKYRAVKNARFITWLRHPVERLGSHYYYWTRNYRPEEALPLHKRVVEEQWSLERFCFSKELRNLYNEFMWGFPIKKFDFIGITEHFSSDMNYFSKHLLGIELQSHHMNANIEKKSTSYFESQDFRQSIESFHSKDMALYNYALKLRRDRTT